MNRCARCAQSLRDGPRIKDQAVLPADGKLAAAKWNSIRGLRRVHIGSYRERIYLDRYVSNARRYAWFRKIRLRKCARHISLRLKGNRSHRMMTPGRGEPATRPANSSNVQSLCCGSIRGRSPFSGLEDRVPTKQWCGDAADCGLASDARSRAIRSAFCRE